MGSHQGEVLVKDAHESPHDADLHYDRYKEQSRSVLESKNVDTNLNKEDDDKHEDSADGAEGEDHPEALPRSIVVGQDCLHHREEGDAH